MHGIVFNQLIKFVRENHGKETLDIILKDAGIGSKFYDSTKAHPDEELEKILASTCKMLNLTRDVALEAFGVYMTPGLLKTYAAFIKKEWGAMDLLEKIEGTIHRTVRMNNPEAAPPALDIKRVGEKEVTINYTSPRDMLQFGVGIIKGIGLHYGVKLDVNRTNYDDKQVLKITQL